MTYGTKRWALGMGCGMSAGMALCFYEQGASQGVGLMGGMAIILFFADYFFAQRSA